MYFTRRFGRLVLAAALASAAAGAFAGSVTIVTFSDPAPGETTPLFTLNGPQFQGGWSGTGLNLLSPGLTTVPDYGDAKFSMTPLIATPIAPGSWTLSGGQITFTDAANTPVFVITFDAASLASNIGFGASDLALQNVTFSVPGQSSVTFEKERFAFSFANDAETPEGLTWTASFTSSATVWVPEPASFGLLAAGALGSILRRRQA